MVSTELLVRHRLDDVRDTFSLIVEDCGRIIHGISISGESGRQS